MRITENQLKDIVKKMLNEHGEYSSDNVSKRLKNTVSSCVKMPDEQSQDVHPTFVDDVVDWMLGFTNNPWNEPAHVQQRLDLFTTEFGYEISLAAMRKMMQAFQKETGY